ncbi:MAG: uroporphyrinogen decarboxylase family protein [Candidatus Humimicrobiaceae bacterium]
MENSRELMINCLNFKKISRLPVSLHWWGIYKYESAGLDFKKDAWQEGIKISEVYIKFYEKFRPDWFHLHAGTPKYFKDSEIVKKDGKYILSITDKYRDLKKEDKYFSSGSAEDEEIIDFPDYLLSSRARKPKVDLSSKKKINDYIDKYIHLSSKEIIELGYTDHLNGIFKKYNKDAFLAVHIPSAICEIFDPTTGYLGFEEGLLAFYDQPEGMQYFLERCYIEQLEWAKAYAERGADAFIISESYISPDLANPDIYRKFLKHIHKDYFKEISDYGIEPLCLFWGNINPLLDDYCDVNVKGMLIEESKKGFDLDIVKIRQKTEGRVCLFGNLDSLNLLNSGTSENIKNEALRQSKGLNTGFIISNGSPITPGTPVENVKALIDFEKGV